MPWGIIVSLLGEIVSKNNPYSNINNLTSAYNLIGQLGGLKGAKIPDKPNK